MFLHVFVTFLLFLCIFVRLCVVLPLRHALAPCMAHGIGMHVMHHIVIVVFIIMLIMFIMMMIDRHDVHRSLFVDHSLNTDYR